ncbi:hypothetical protein [Glycomyces buryatensis]|uniref:Uncharacterized protein n=1 Tax=Glycomyces buryatensis TaxID=2570927 RepID=A0A4S8QD76_9ACTN|nr:hypothetical protein [Glycomyces buryatensis]THV41571.1 hypothetical protein FAB82_10705 [Glycomyces buryatensis]
MTSEQGNTPEQGEAPDDRARDTDASPEQGSNPPPAPESAEPDDTNAASEPADDGEKAPPVEDEVTQAIPTSALAGADIPAAPAADEPSDQVAAEPSDQSSADQAAAEPEAPAPAPEPEPAAAEPAAPVEDDATQAIPTSALADADIPAAPAADSAPEPEAAAEPDVPEAAAPAEPEPEPAAPAVEPEPEAAPPAPAAETPVPEPFDADVTQAIPKAASMDFDIPAAPAADAPAQVPPVEPEPVAPAAEPEPHESPVPSFDEGGTTILRFNPGATPGEMPAAEAPYQDNERTEVLPPQGVGGFNAPAPYGEDLQSGVPADQATAWPSPPPNPLAGNAMPPADQQQSSQPQMQQPQQQQPQQQPPQGYAQQPPPVRSDDTQKLIIGPANPQSEPPASAVPGYGPSQPGSPQQQPSQPGMAAGQYPPAGMPPGQMPPGAMGTGQQYPPQAPAKSGKSWLIPGIAIAVVLVLGIAVGAWFMFFRGPAFEPGGCVTKVSEEAVEPVDCADATDGEDFEITKEVDNGAECKEEERESMEYEGVVYCLTLLGEEEAEPAE